MNLLEYIEKSKNKAFFTTLEMNFSEEERMIMEQFCDLDINKTNKNIAFSCILDTIMDNEKENMLTDRLLDSLIDQEVALSSLCHMNLKDEWLIKIYNKNPDHYECMLTVYRRNIISDTSYLDFINIVKNNSNPYSIFYTLIDLSNYPVLSLLQIEKILFLSRTYVTDFDIYPFMKKYTEYFMHWFDLLLIGNLQRIERVFCKEDFSKLYRIKNQLQSTL